MSSHFIIESHHLNLDRKAVQAELKVFQQAVRSFDDLEEWVAARVALFFDVPLKIGDNVKVNVSPHMKDLEKLTDSKLFTPIDIEIKRTTNAAPDFEDAFIIKTSENASTIQHRAITYLPLKDWPMITAELVANYSEKKNFDSTVENFAKVSAYIDPYLSIHFPKLNMALLRELHSLEVLPKNREELITYMYGTRNVGNSLSVPEDMSL